MIQNQNNALFSWSSGKDSALALYELETSHHLKVNALFTTLTHEFSRVSIHGVREELVTRQAHALNLPLETVLISKHDDMDEYNRKINAFWENCRAKGISSVGFGDIYLEDVKEYRVQQLAPFEIAPIFPLWQKDSIALIHQFIRLGFKAVISCVDTEKLDASFAGRKIDEDFLRDLPDHVDPCGENGEFHTFVYDGPLFRQPVRFSLGETVIRNGLCYRDLLPESP